ncbi:sensor histidine kinase [Actinomadura flavalba]|uniref:sensor histidine kinase n=1 Tax=Actinomadura flavalba TaxID=1120938 RepID=UPI00035F9CC7|nr:HAMP domain-containing sensor histidine kinase [Actinomadura flavalba]
MTRRPGGRRRPSIRRRLTLTTVLITLLLSLAVYALILLLIQRQEVGVRERELGREARRLVAVIQTRNLPRDGHLVADPGARLQIIDPAGQVAAASDAMVGRPPVAFAPPDPEDDRRDGSSCTVNTPGDECVQIAVIRTYTAEGSWLAYALMPSTGLFPRPAEALLSSLWIPFVVGLVGLGTWRSAGRTLRPVEQIRSDLDEITATDLQRRVSVSSEYEEIGRLAETVNATLDRLEGAVARQRSFVSDVSHELRSPLAGLRTELELALQDADGDLKESLTASLRSADRLQGVVEDLLALARLEAADKGPAEPVDLRRLADEEVLRRPHTTQVVVPDGDPVIVHGSREQLARLFTNLIDNADRHARTEVRLDIRRLPGGYAMVEVIDDGPGPTAIEREQVRERSTRLAGAGHRDAGGTALRLTVARDIAVAHRGSLDVEDRVDGRPGARFVLLLPA